MPNPPLPSNIGKRGTLRSYSLHFRILDEVAHIQSTDLNKAIYLQQIQFEDKGNIELRLGYYIIGRKPKMKGKWTWGQYATMMPVKDLKAIIRKATEKGWI